MQICPSSEGQKVCSIQVTAAAALAVAITFLVLGILGANGTLSIAPVGARLLAALGAGTILGMFAGVLRACAK